MQPRVRLVVLNYNGGHDVVRCVQHLAALEWPEDRLELVLVDNASVDGSVEAAVRAVPRLRVIDSPRNLGFPANNLALDDLDGLDFVGLVNNDAFVEPGYLSPLVEALSADAALGAACPKILLDERFVAVEQHPAAGAPLELEHAVPGPGWVVPDVLDDPRPRAIGGRATAYVATDDDGPAVLDLVANVGSELTPDWFGRDRGLHEIDRGQFDHPQEVFAWCGAAVLFPVRYLRDVGLFDERLFLYYEDLDLAWRGRSRGWRYRTAPGAVVRHRLGASSQVGSALFRYHVERNRLVVLVEHAPATVAAGAALRHLLATASYVRRAVLRPLGSRRADGRLVVLRLRAFGGFVRLLPHALATRRRVSRRATNPAYRRQGQPTGHLPHSGPS